MNIQFKPINWRLLLLHFLAVPFLIIGAQQLERIRWIPIVTVYQQRGVMGLQQLNMGIAEMITGMLAGPLYAWAWSLVGGCLLSMLVVWQRQESKLIPVLLFGLATVSSWTHYYESEPVVHVLAYLRGSFPTWSMSTRFGLGGALLCLGLLPFIFTWQRPA
jgi:hypothetical protein